MHAIPFFAPPIFFETIFISSCVPVQYCIHTPVYHRVMRRCQSSDQATGKPADAIQLDPHVAALRYLTLDSLKCVRAFGVSESGVATGPVLVREVRSRVPSLAHARVWWCACGVLEIVCADSRLS